MGGSCDDVEVDDDTLFEAEPSITSFAICCVAANPGDVDCVHPAAVEVFSDGDARALDDESSLFSPKVGSDSDTAGDVHTISDTGLLELDFACEAVTAVGGSLWFLGGAFGDGLLATSRGCWCGGGGSGRDSEPSWPFTVSVPGCLLSTLCWVTWPQSLAWLLSTVFPGPCPFFCFLSLWQRLGATGGSGSDPCLGFRRVPEND